MRTALICTAAPAATFVSVAEMKVQLQIDADDITHDTLLQALLDAVCDHLDGADGILKRSIGQQTWKLVLPSFQCGPKAARIDIPLPPLQTIDGITYYDSGNVQQTIAIAGYTLIQRGADPSWLVPPDGGWPATYGRDDAVTVTFTAGFGDGQNQVVLPKQIKQAAIVVVRKLYDMGEHNVFQTGETVFGVGSNQYQVSPAALAVMDQTAQSLLFNQRVLRL